MELSNTTMTTTTAATTTTTLSSAATTAPTTIGAVITTTAKDDSFWEVDGFFIGALVCLGVGAILLIAGFVRLIMWLVALRKNRELKKKRQRHLDHMRHLEEYSIKAGYSPNHVIVQNNNTQGTADGDSVFKWDTGLVNAGYISEDTLERHSPKEPKLSAHETGSRPTSSYSNHGNHDGVRANPQTGTRPESRPTSISGIDMIQTPLKLPVNGAQTSSSNTLTKRRSSDGDVKPKTDNPPNAVTVTHTINNDVTAKPAKSANDRLADVPV